MRVLFFFHVTLFNEVPWKASARPLVLWGGPCDRAGAGGLVGTFTALPVRTPRPASLHPWLLPLTCSQALPQSVSGLQVAETQ